MQPLHADEHGWIIPSTCLDRLQFEVAAANKEWSPDGTRMVTLCVESPETVERVEDATGLPHFERTVRVSIEQGNAGDLLLRKVEILCARADNVFWSRKPESVNEITFLTAVAVCTRQLGWVGRTKAGAEGLTPTANHAWNLCSIPVGDDKRAEWRAWVEQCGLHATAEDRTKAEEALLWARSISTDPTKTPSGYLYNLGVASRQADAEGVRYATTGLLASAIWAHQQHLDEHTGEGPSAGLTHIGVVGERRVFADLDCITLKTFDGSYGDRTLCRFEDVDGNIVVWWASGRPEWLAENGVFDLVGRVKAHDDYRGKPETVLTRVRMAKEGEE